MGLSKELNIDTGKLRHGSLNLISDVNGIKVGHCTLASNDIQTGVTAIIPHEENLFEKKLLAATYVINGFGKSIGLMQINELGTLETPIILTNTLSVGTAASALVEYMLEQNPSIGETTGTVNPVVCECNDMKLNNIRSLSIKSSNVFEAIENSKKVFDEGSVGAGRGMRCHGLKGGIGSSSRVFEIGDNEYTLGTLVLTNHGRYEDLIINGQNLPEKYPYHNLDEPDKGSVIVIIATDVPLNERQLLRISKRAIVGLCKTGSFVSNGSGELVISFSTANTILHETKEIIDIKRISDDLIDIVFQAVSESVYESVLSSLFNSETVTGRNGYTCYAIEDILSKIF